MRAAREPRWFLPRASRLARKLNSQLRAQMALVNEQMTTVSEAQARVGHLKTCLGSVERKLDDRRREFERIAKSRSTAVWKSNFGHRRA